MLSDDDDIRIYTHTGHPPLGGVPDGIQILHWRQSSVMLGISKGAPYCGHSAESPVKSVGLSCVPYLKSSGSALALFHRCRLVNRQA